MVSVKKWLKTDSPPTVPVLFITTYKEIRDVNLPVKGNYVIDKEAGKAWGNANLRMMPTGNGLKYGMILDERYSAPVYVEGETPWNPGRRKDIVSYFYGEAHRTVGNKKNRDRWYMKIFTIAIYGFIALIILTLVLNTFVDKGSSPTVIENTNSEVITP